jgi:very-short-patch-repair endonuclease
VQGVTVPRRPLKSRLHVPSTRSSAAAAGLSDWHLRHRDINRTSRDTYLPAGATELDDRVAAVMLSAPADAVVSHHTAAAFWRIAIPLQDRADDDVVHLTAPARSRARNRADRRIHRGPVDTDELFLRWSAPVTNPERTWRDLAAVLPPGPLLAVTDQLLVGRTDVAALQAMLERHPTGRGSARARLVLPQASPWSESPMESVLRWILHEAGLPSPELQHVVRDASGRFLGRADLAWPERRVLVEFDGDVHRERTVFVRDLRRQNALVAAGWTVLRFSSADVVGRPEYVVAAVRAALGLRPR